MPHLQNASKVAVHHVQHVDAQRDNGEIVQAPCFCNRKYVDGELEEKRSSARLQAERYADLRHSGQSRSLVGLFSRDV